MFNGLRALMRTPSLQERYRRTPFFDEKYYLEQFTSNRPLVAPGSGESETSGEPEPEPMAK